MSLIELKGVTKGFFLDSKKSRASVAVNDIDLCIEEGEFVSLIGPSGCGKTVTLSMIAGFEAPTIGEVLFKGQPIVKPGPERGVVFQEYSLLPWQTVVQNVMFAVRNSARHSSTLRNSAQHGSTLRRSARQRLDQREGEVRLSRAGERERALDALRTVGLADIADRRPNTLSGGMKQRVAIARLLAMDSEVFLMDEPFSALDEQTRADLDASLFELWKQRGKTVVFVTHNISEAVLMSSRIVLFSAAPGRIIAEWRLPRDLERDLSSPELICIADEIRSQLPLSPASFSVADDEAGLVE